MCFDLKRYYKREFSHEINEIIQVGFSIQKIRAADSEFCFWVWAFRKTAIIQISEPTNSLRQLFWLKLNTMFVTRVHI